MDPFTSIDLPENKILTALQHINTSIIPKDSTLMMERFSKENAEESYVENLPQTLEECQMRPDSNHWKEAIESEMESLIKNDSNHWKEAIESEMESLIKNDTWTLVRRPENAKIISCRWHWKETIESEMESLIKNDTWTLKFGMLDCKPISTPMEPALNITIENEDKGLETIHRQLIGCLLYATMCSRPDICYAVTYLSRFQHKPNTETWTYMKRVLRYLKDLADLKEFLTAKIVLNLEKCHMSECLGICTPIEMNFHVDTAEDVEDFWTNQSTVWILSRKPSVMNFKKGIYILYLKGLAENFLCREVKTSLKLDSQGAVAMIKNYENTTRS
ncbi:hypothetical protein QE152_g10368 [Popillia japonica]|uniref:Uncharacterized protein n=1 Tax=Popillia japonica TaxID=7064 RepID=A0AAW1LRQ7_POPJA